MQLTAAAVTPPAEHAARRPAGAAEAAATDAGVRYTWSPDQMRCFIGVFLICLFHCSCGEWRAVDSKRVDPELERIGDEIQSEMQAPPEIEIQGFYGWGFEYSAISLCESGEVYWADGEEIHKAFSDLNLPFRAEAFARLRGRVLGPGSYGHMGAYKWGFEVTKVLEMRPKRKGDCK